MYSTATSYYIELTITTFTSALTLFNTPNTFPGSWRSKYAKMLPRLGRRGSWQLSLPDLWVKYELVATWRGGTIRRARERRKGNGDRGWNGRGDNGECVIAWGYDTSNNEITWGLHKYQWLLYFFHTYGTNTDNMTTMDRPYAVYLLQSRLVVPFLQSSIWSICL